jgi:hypothetical protein
MGKECEQTFLQRRHTHGQRAHISHWRNKNHNEIPFTPTRIAIIKDTGSL